MKAQGFSPGSRIARTFRPVRATDRGRASLSGRALSAALSERFDMAFSTQG